MGRLQGVSGDFKSAEKTFGQSVVAALAGRNDEALARAWVYLISVAEETGRYERGHEAAGYAAAVLERLENADELRAALFTVLGALLIKEGKYTEALEHSQRAREIWQRVFGPEHPNVADAISNAALALRQLGR